MHPPPAGGPPGAGLAPELVGEPGERRGPRSEGGRGHGRGHRAPASTTSKKTSSSSERGRPNPSTLDLLVPQDLAQQVPPVGPPVAEGDRERPLVAVDRGRGDDVGHPRLPAQVLHDALATAGERQPEGVVVAAGQELVEGGLHHPAAALEDRDLVTDLLDVIEDVGGVEHGGRLLQGPHHRQDVTPAQRVERRRGFVEDEQRGPVDLSLGDAEPLALAPRQVTGAAVGLRGEPHEVEHVGDLVLDVAVPRKGEEAGGVPQHLPRRQLLVEVRLLGQVTDQAADGQALAADVVPEHRRRATGGGGQAEEHPHQGRLPGAVRAEEAEEGALRNLQVQAPPAPRRARSAWSTPDSRWRKAPPSHRATGRHPRPEA